MPLKSVLTTGVSKDEMLSYIKKNPEQFLDAVKLSITDEQPYAWRATWMIGHTMKYNDHRLQPYINQYIQILPQKPDGQQREIIKILKNLKLDDEQEGRLFDHCMNIWESVKKSPSVRHFSFKFITDTVKKYPELKSEILFLLDDEYLESLSPGIKRSIIKLKKEMKTS